MKISTYTYYFAVLFLVLIFFLGLLKGPIVPDDIQSKNCARNVVLPFNFGVTLNCDSGIYIRLASDLNLLFENTRVVNDRNLTPGNVEQATPGSSVLVWIISKPIIKIWKSIQFYTENTVKNVKDSLNTVYSQLNINQTVDDSFENFTDLIPVYISYIILNTLIMILCIILYTRTLKIRLFNFKPVFAFCFLIGSIILINDVNKQFFYSPGPQIFRLLCPVFTVYFASRILEAQNISKEYLIGSFITGFLMLFYYIFFVAFLTISFAFFLSKDKGYAGIHEDHTIKKYFFATILFLITSFIWFIICYLINDSVLVADMTHEGFGLFIIIEKFNSFGFYQTLIFFIDSIIRTFFHSLIHSWIIVFLLIFSLFLIKLNLNNLQNKLLKVCFFFSIFSILFFSFYSPGTSRLVFSSFLVFVPFIGLISKTIYEKIKFKNLFFSLYFVIFIFYTLNTIIKTEPFGWYNEKGSYYFIR